jgi:hypothetical protein
MACDSDPTDVTVPDDRFDHRRARHERSAHDRGSASCVIAGDEAGNATPPKVLQTA